MSLLSSCCKDPGPFAKYNGWQALGRGFVFGGLLLERCDVLGHGFGRPDGSGRRRLSAELERLKRVIGQVHHQQFPFEGMVSPEENLEYFTALQ